MEKKKFEKNKIDLIVKLYQDGKSIKYIARTFKMSQGVITTVLNDVGILYDGLLKIKNRFEKDKTYVAICKKTNKEFDDFKNTSGGLTVHISSTYPDFKIESKFKRKQVEIKTGRFWYEDFFDIIEISKEKKETLKCKLCDYETIDLTNASGALTKHLKNLHNLSSIEYAEKFPDTTKLFQTAIDKNSWKQDTLLNVENNVQCNICGEKMRILNHSHLKKHKINMEQYKRLYDNKVVSDSSHKKLKENCGNSDFFKWKDTNIEIMMSNKLNSLFFNFEQQKRNDSYIFDFFIPEHEIFIEADGLYWHGHDRQSNWNFKVFNNVINDYKKSKKVNNRKLFRLIENISINETKLNQIHSKDQFYNFLIKENFDVNNHKILNLRENEVLFNKEHCIKHIDNIGDKDLKKLVDNLYFWWNNFYPPDKNEKFVDLNSRNNDYKLKGIFFEQFYNAKKFGNDNLFEMFADDKNEDLFKKTIKYRLGLNEAKEYFDINIKNLYRGIEVRTMFNVGIFPTKQSKEIMERFIIDHNKTVYDPFTGWGSRLLSVENLIKTKNCKYIGNDINSTLESGYEKIVERIFHDYKNNIELFFSSSINHIDKLNENVDFIFTSPPFYNDEIYTKNTIIFNSTDEWRKNLLEPVFINCYKYLKNGCYLVIDMKESYIEQTELALKNAGFNVIRKESYKVNKSHFNKNNQKEQFIIISRKPYSNI